MFNVHFEYPLVWAILVLFCACSLWCKVQPHTLYIPHLLSMPLHVKRSKFSFVLKWLSIVMMLLALSSPTIRYQSDAVKLSHAVMLLMDVSESMSRAGLDTRNSKSKFDMSKEIAASFIEQRENDNVGVIVFGDFAYVATPLTFDHQSASNIVQNLNEGIAGKRTAMYDALFLATRLLQKNSAKEKVVILLTDGFNTAGKITLEAVLRTVESEKIKVYAIGIGRSGEYDETLLNLIAQKSGGVFFRANSEQMLVEVYQKIDTMEKSLQKSEAPISINYLYMYPLLVALVALFWYVYRRIKEGGL
ncbi:MAG: VWA domain-containing protein [Sulfuricurvum sp.]|uniref:VWA domain-containing protein n=1 Tax=Sulfuricurvum sp. TaxID=2025608 RepID=UPI002604FB0A|nr:VWA domain-containing protein [Sulfuricurvum sp.]MDD2784876.1 VWA domain-containing protein [Sulfuricurvum sp.]